MPRALLIAIGNPLRHDDGVARQVLERIRPRADVEHHPVLQLTPEVAATLAGADLAVFIDASIADGGFRLEPLTERSAPPALTHVLHPAEILGLARRLFGFAGQAYLCSIPVENLSPGEGLSEHARDLAEHAAARLEALLAALP